MAVVADGVCDSVCRVCRGCVRGFARVRVGVSGAGLSGVGSGVGCHANVL